MPDPTSRPFQITKNPFVSNAEAAAQFRSASPRVTPKVVHERLDGSKAMERSVVRQDHGQAEVGQGPADCLLNFCTATQKERQQSGAISRGAGRRLREHRDVYAKYTIPSFVAVGRNFDGVPAPIAPRKNVDKKADKELDLILERGKICARVARYPDNYLGGLYRKPRFGHMLMVRTEPQRWNS
jgi:hypothetical protein